MVGKQLYVQVGGNEYLVGETSMPRPYYPPQGGLKEWIPPQGIAGKAVEVPVTPPPPIQLFHLGIDKLDEAQLG